jgi:LmbE family N-acetylglucosaminyl deacetylase
MSPCFASNKRVLVVIAHQDDEALFCGALLSQIRGTSEVTVICMSKPKQERTIEARNECFRRACEKVQARAITTTFPEARHVWSSAELLWREQPQQMASMQELLRREAGAFRPDVVITHNAAGEYGHCYHKVVHRVCRRVFPPDKLYFIGIGSHEIAGQRFVVTCDPSRKKELLECHPYFDAVSFCKRHFGQVIAYEPETYIACGKQEYPTAPLGSAAITRQLAADFLRFWIRKLRAKLTR